MTVARISNVSMLATYNPDARWHPSQNIVAPSSSNTAASSFRTIGSPRPSACLNASACLRIQPHDVSPRCCCHRSASCTSGLSKSANFSWRAFGCSAGRWVIGTVASSRETHHGSHMPASSGRVPILTEASDGSPPSSEREHRERRRTELGLHPARVPSTSDKALRRGRGAT